MLVCMDPSSPPVKRTLHLLKTPDILLVNDSGPTGNYLFDNTSSLMLIGGDRTGTLDRELRLRVSRELRSDSIIETNGGYGLPLIHLNLSLTKGSFDSSDLVSLIKSASLPDWPRKTRWSRSGRE